MTLAVFYARKIKNEETGETVRVILDIAAISPNCEHKINGIVLSILHNNVEHYGEVNEDFSTTPCMREALENVPIDF